MTGQRSVTEGHDGQWCYLSYLERRKNKQTALTKESYLTNCAISNAEIDNSVIFVPILGENLNMWSQ